MPFQTLMTLFCFVNLQPLSSFSRDPTVPKIFPIFPTNDCHGLLCFRLRLRYEGIKGTPDFCEGHSPAVTITFICPSTRQAVRTLHKTY